MSDQRCRYSKSITPVICHSIYSCTSFVLSPCPFADVVIDLESRLAIMADENDRLTYENGRLHDAITDRDFQGACDE